MRWVAARKCSRKGNCSLHLLSGCSEIFSKTRQGAHMRQTCVFNVAYQCSGCSMDLRSSPQPVSTSGSTALVHGGAQVHSLRTRSWPSRCRPPRRLHVQAALKEVTPDRRPLSYRRYPGQAHASSCQCAASCRGGCESREPAMCLYTRSCTRQTIGRK